MPCSQRGSRFRLPPPTRVTSVTRTQGTNQWERACTALRGDLAVLGQHGDSGVPPRRTQKGARAGVGAGGGLWGPNRWAEDHRQEMHFTQRTKESSGGFYGQDKDSVLGSFKDSSGMVRQTVQSSPIFPHGAEGYCSTTRTQAANTDQALTGTLHTAVFSA